MDKIFFHPRRTGIIVTIAVVALAFIIYYLFSPEERTPSNVMAIFSIALGVLSIFFTFFQFRSDKELKKHIAEIIRQSINRERGSTLVEEIQSKKHFIYEISFHMGQGEYKIASCLMKQVVDLLIYIRSYGELADILQRSETQATISGILDDNANISGFLGKSNDEPDKTVINRHLDEVYKLLQDITNNLKKIRDDEYTGNIRID